MVGKNESRIERKIKKLKDQQEKERRKSEIKKGNSRPRRRSEPDNIKNNDEAVQKNMSWFSSSKKLIERKELISERLKEYSKPIKINTGKTFTPQLKDIEEFEKKLNSLKLKQLRLMGHLIGAPLKLDRLDRLKSINKKDHAVVTIFNDNKTTDTGVIHCYDRTFSRRDMSYMVMGERGIYDPEFKMMHFYYFANQPFPIIFEKGERPENTYDSRLIDDTIQMKVIEALAAVDIEKFVKITLVCIILSLIMNGIILLILANDHGLIPKGG